ncbi:MAG: O-antigen ligase family protein, partial [Nitrospiraceae bacterium]
MLSTGNISRVLLWGIKGVLFLIPLIPLYVSPSLVFPYITGKNFAFRILVEFAAALWVSLISINREYRPRSSPILISVLVFTFVIGLADLFGVSPYNSFWSNYERMEGYITILHLALYFMIMTSVLRSRKDWMVLFNIVVSVSGLVSVYALSAPPPEQSQFAVIYGRRIYGTLGNPPFLASYLLLSLFFAILLILETKRRFLKLVYLFIVTINVVAIYFSASRGAILGALVGGLIFGLIYSIRNINAVRINLGRKVLLSLLGLLIILTVMISIVRNTDFRENDSTLSRFATMFSDPSVQNRFIAWEFALNGIKERPLLGWGQENFIGVYTVNTIPFDKDEQMWLDRAHNIVLDWLVNAGVLGLLSYLAILATAYYVLVSFMRKKLISTNVALTLFTVLIVYFIQNLFTFDTISTYFLFFTLLAYLTNTKFAKKGEYQGEESVACSGWPGIKAVSLVTISLIVFSFSCYYINYKPAKESQLYLRITKSTNQYHSFLEILDDVDSALSLKTFGDFLIAQGMRAIALQIARFDIFDDKGAREFVARTVEVLEKGLSVFSHDLDYLTDNIIFYKEAASREPFFVSKAESLVKEGMRINPGYQWLYMALADISVIKKDYEGAYLNVKKVVEMDPQNDQKQLKFALAAILYQRADIASKALENVRKIRADNNAMAY